MIPAKEAPDPSGGAPVTVTGAEKFSVHDEPAWLDRADFVIDGKLPDREGFARLCVRRLTDGNFEICCIPFFLYGVALGDTVQTRESDGRKHLLHRVVQASGRYVFRAQVGLTSHPREELVKRLTELGAVMESFSESLLAIDAMDLQHAQGLARFLGERAEAEQLAYELGEVTGHRGRLQPEYGPARRGR